MEKKEKGGRENKMAKLEVVEYGKENGQLIAIEVYSDGSTRKVQIKEGIVDYILKGSKK